jgi:hypothetical protein
MGEMITKPDANPILLAILNVAICGIPVGYFMMGQLPASDRFVENFRSAVRAARSMGRKPNGRVADTASRVG